MNGAELIVSALENEGVQQIFGIPGEENLDVVEALRRSTIKLVLTRHEQAAAFMAALTSSIETFLFSVVTSSVSEPVMTGTR